MTRTCAICGRRIEDMAQAEREYGELRDDADAYKHFKPDESDPSGRRGFYDQRDHFPVPSDAHYE
jgi:hypothetical protein